MNNIFLKVDGVPGESRDAVHQGWMDVDAYSWGVNRSTGEVGGAISNYRNLIVHCQVDKGTSAMLLRASNGNKVKTVELSACKAGGEQVEYYRVTLENVIITGVFLRDNGAVTDVEYEFQADKVKFQYWEQGSIGVKGAESRMGWDIKNTISCF